jgi:hypothetical protein
MSDDERMNSCPHCGDKPRAGVDSSGYGYVECDCGSFLSERKPSWKDDEAIAAWNRRSVTSNEAVDVVTVWSWINQHGGEITHLKGDARTKRPLVSLQHPNSIYEGTRKRFEFFEMSEAAKWIRHEREMEYDR